jgi:hypothetical protein
MYGQNPMANCWPRGGRRHQARAAQKRVEASSRLVRSTRGFQWPVWEVEELSELSFLRIPTLRDRKTDIEILVAYFMECMQRETGMAHALSDEAPRPDDPVRLAGQQAGTRERDPTRSRLLFWFRPVSGRLATGSAELSSWL